MNLLNKANEMDILDLDKRIEELEFKDAKFADLQAEFDRLKREIEHFRMAVAQRIDNLNQFQRDAQLTFDLLNDAVKHNAKVVTDFMQNQITVQWATLKPVDE